MRARDAVIGEAERGEALKDFRGVARWAPRWYGQGVSFDPEAALHRASDKFANRFHVVEQLLAAEGKAPSDATLSEMEAHWMTAKQTVASP